jgi:hypothetical protein
MKKNDPKIPQWKIAQEIGICQPLTKAEMIDEAKGKKDPNIIVKKATMTAAVSRNLKIAKKLISNVGLGKFPLS